MSENSRLLALAKALRRGETSSEQLTRDALARIGQSKLNAFIDVLPERSIEQAKVADQRLAAGDDHPLLGIPLAHKDIFVTRHWRSTAGSRMLANYVSPFDAAVVERLAQAGMVCVGKLNCDEFAMGSTNEHSYFGAVSNPWDLQRVPGGSSGASAAVVAAGMLEATTGTDTGGSIRQPAALCGVTGIKPSYGRVSRWGMIAFASSLDQAGPMARSAADCALLLQAMAGFDARDATCRDLPVENFSRGIGRALEHASESMPLRGLRIGLPTEWFADGLDAGQRRVIEAAIADLERLGAQSLSVSLPRTDLSIPAYYVIAPAEASSNLARFDGVRFGHRASEVSDLESLYERSRAEGFGAEVKRRIMVGTYVLSQGYYDAYYVQAQRLRRLIAQDFAQALSQCDLLLGPVTPTAAWPKGAMQDDPTQMYLADVYTLGASLAGLPGMSVPCGFVGEPGLPVGMQLVGADCSEALLLQVADLYQQATAHHRAMPAESSS
ncbi:MAG: Asp-tRNA(Asn)/Glu-tRNA(Gln) amidotransferase subunit GatA, partial [Betaproteobacteria bacterium]|nr:Asp-tRNA(Asn)/Glu-tRNA(Gln) amidotransferase subunit GatA [Betaproteobacteria bacterium]